MNDEAHICSSVLCSCCIIHIVSSWLYKMLSCRRQTALQSALVLTKSETLKLGENISGHNRSIFNHCKIISLQSYRIRWKNCTIRAITPFKVIQGHQGRYQSKTRVRLPILVINSNWHSISYRYWVIAAYCSKFGHFAFSSNPLEA